MTKTTIEEELKRISDVNEAFADRARELEREFTTPLVCGPNDPVGLARRLSERFPELEVSLRFSQRGQRIDLFAKPRFEPFKADSRQTSFVRDVATKAEEALKGIDSHFPTFQIASVYAQGVNDTADSKRKLEDLQRKYDELRERVRDDMRPRGFHPMFGPMW